MEGIDAGKARVDVQCIGFVVEVEQGFHTRGQAGLTSERERLTNQHARRMDGDRVDGLVRLLHIALV